MSCIDHVVCPCYFVDYLTKSEILHDEPDNLSDHLALSTTLELLVPVQSKYLQVGKKQGKYIKTVLCHSYNTHTSKLLEAVNITKVYKIIQMTSLDLLRFCPGKTSVSRYFYAYLLHNVSSQKCNSLVDRSSKFCEDYGVNLMRYLLNKGYVDMVNNKLKHHLEGIGGIVDSIRTLVYIYS